MTGAARRALVAAAGLAAAVPAALADCGPVDLAVESVVDRPAPYQDFCDRRPGDCDLSGPDRIDWTPAARDLVEDVDRAVDGEVRVMPDPEWRGVEEYWDYPVLGCGDCEDFALEKRRRLVEAGLPRGAMTMAIVHHRALMFSHAVLLVRTEEGTFALDNLSDEVLCWSGIPYNFEMRERPDGSWVRYDQGDWTFDDRS